jgi:hypothetical protein
MAAVYAPMMRERHDQQLVNLPVLSLIIYARPRFAKSTGSGRLASNS